MFGQSCVLIPGSESERALPYRRVLMHAFMYQKVQSF